MIQRILALILLISLVAANDLVAKVFSDLDTVLPAPLPIRIHDNIRTYVLNSSDIYNSSDTFSEYGVPAGYWKISSDTFFPIKCPISEACLGLFLIVVFPYSPDLRCSSLKSNLVLHNVGGSDFSIGTSQSCAVGYSGPLCDKCVIGRWKRTFFNFNLNHF